MLFLDLRYSSGLFYAHIVHPPEILPIQNNCHHHRNHICHRLCPCQSCSSEPCVHDEQRGYIDESLTDSHGQHNCDHDNFHSSPNACHHQITMCCYPGIHNDLGYTYKKGSQRSRNSDDQCRSCHMLFHCNFAYTDTQGRLFSQKICQSTIRNMFPLQKKRRLSPIRPGKHALRVFQGKQLCQACLNTAVLSAYSTSIIASNIP